MIRSIKTIAIAVIAAPLLLMGCSDLFDKGDTEKAYTGPDQVAFKTIENEIDEGGSQTLEVQLISSEGTIDSDVEVEFSVSSTDNYSSDYFSVTGSPVVIEAGSASTTIQVDTSDDPDFDSGEAEIVLDITGSNGPEVATNLSTSTVFVAGQ